MAEWLSEEREVELIDIGGRLFPYCTKLSAKNTPKLPCSRVGP